MGSATISNKPNIPLPTYVQFLTLDIAPVMRNFFLVFLAIVSCINAHVSGSKRTEKSSMTPVSFSSRGDDEENDLSARSSKSNQSKDDSGKEKEKLPLYHKIYENAEEEKEKEDDAKEKVKERTKPSRNRFRKWLTRENSFLRIASNLRSFLQDRVEKYLSVMGSSDFNGVDGLNETGFKAIYLSSILENFCDDGMTLPCNKLNKLYNLEYTLDNMYSELQIGNVYSDLILIVTIRSFNGLPVLFHMAVVIELKYIRGGYIKGYYSSSDAVLRRNLTTLSRELKESSASEILGNWYRDADLKRFVAVDYKVNGNALQNQVEKYVRGIFDDRNRSSIPNDLRKIRIVGFGVVGVVNRVLQPDNFHYRPSGTADDIESGNWDKLNLE